MYYIMKRINKFYGSIYLKSILFSESSKLRVEIIFEKGTATEINNVDEFIQP